MTSSFVEFHNVLSKYYFFWRAVFLIRKKVLKLKSIGERGGGRFSVVLILLIAFKIRKKNRFNLY